MKADYCFAISYMQMDFRPGTHSVKSSDTVVNNKRAGFGLLAILSGNKFVLFQILNNSSCSPSQMFRPFCSGFEN